MGRGTEDDQAYGAASPMQIPARGWTAILRRVLHDVIAENVMLVAGGVTFYLLLALFPALAAFVSLYGLFLDPADIPGHASALRMVLPRDGVAIVEAQLEALAAQAGGALTFGFLASLIVALWSANSGMKAIIESLNIAYDVAETRSFLRLTLVALAFTLGAMLVAAMMILTVGVIPATLAFLDLDGAGDWLPRLLRWPILLVVIAGGLAALYRYGPSRGQARAPWRWVSWGSGLATAVWLGASIGFGVYLERFANYNVTYGSLGALVGLLLWIWIAMMIVIVGAELNAEIEREARDEAPPRAAAAAGRPHDGTG